MSIFGPTLVQSDVPTKDNISTCYRDMLKCGKLGEFTYDDKIYELELENTSDLYHLTLYITGNKVAKICCGNGLFTWQQEGKWLGLDTACIPDQYSIYQLVDLREMDCKAISEGISKEKFKGVPIAEAKGGWRQISCDYEVDLRNEVVYWRDGRKKIFSDAINAML